MADERKEGLSMKTHDFWYDLPEELIAQTPLEQRDNSRLLVLDKNTGSLEHKHFYNPIMHKYIILLIHLVIV